MNETRLRQGAAVLALAMACVVMAAGESAQDFAGRISKKPGSAAVVNLREDKSLGAITVSLAPEVLADRVSLQELLGEIARFARDNELRATVVTPTKADNEFVVETLKSQGVARIKTQVMAEMVSIKTTRIFLSPAR